MPIQIDQKFPRCQLCGKIIPLRAERIELARPGERPIGFCSRWCRDEYAARQAAAPSVAEGGRTRGGG
jgi:hypothetical protein